MSHNQNAIQAVQSLQFRASADKIESIIEWQYLLEDQMTVLFHYTDKSGWNGIRSQIDWIFRAVQPHDPSRPVGAYFTDISPNPETLRTLHKRLRVPKSKQEYVFKFREATALVKLNGGSGRDKRIYFSSVDYLVAADRQEYHGPTTDILQGGL